jgi:hypothetical protein
MKTPDQSVPPSVVLIIVPDVPTAYPTLAVGKWTATRRYTVGEAAFPHVAPPSVVLAITPPSPTAHPLLSDGNVTP